MCNFYLSKNKNTHLRRNRKGVAFLYFLSPNFSRSVVILYTTPDGHVNVQVQFEDGTFWLTQKRMAELFGVNVRTINEHLQNIFNSGELDKDSTIRKIRIVQKEGSREVSRELDFYHLDAIIAVGYRVNSYQATRFRVWATNTLREYITKGFVLNDEMLKNGQPILQDKGKVTALEAKLKAEQEYETFRAIQDQYYLSDFDKTIKRIKGSENNKNDT